MPIVTIADSTGNDRRLAHLHATPRLRGCYCCLENPDLAHNAFSYDLSHHLVIIRSPNSAKQHLPTMPQPLCFLPAFPPPLSSSFLPSHRLAPRPLLPRTRPASVSCSTPTSSADHPDAGFISEPGVTGTFSANLWPIPLLGAYGWFLNVYNRDKAAKVGPFVAQFPDPNSILLHFRPGLSESQRSPNLKVFPGVAAGNLNVRNNLRALCEQDSPHELRFFERGASESPLKRRNELHLLDPVSAPPPTPDPLWDDLAPTYRTLRRSSAFEVRALYSSAGTAPRDSPVFEYFCMNLFPLPVLRDYSAFVCVWRQNRLTSPVAVEKRGKHIRLTMCDALPLADGAEEPNDPVGRFAVRVFYGPTSDRVVADLHRSLLAAIRDDPALSAASDVDFRVVMSSAPNTLAVKRRNELWVQLD